MMKKVYEPGVGGLFHPSLQHAIDSGADYLLFNGRLYTLTGREAGIDSSTVHPKVTAYGVEIGRVHGVMTIEDLIVEQRALRVEVTQLYKENKKLTRMRNKIMSLFGLE